MEEFIVANNETQIFKNSLESMKKVPEINSNKKAIPLLRILADEINFINSKVLKDDSTIVYIGETIPITSNEDHGKNLYILSCLFPNMTFHFFDDFRFSDKIFPDLRNSENVQIYERYPEDDEIAFFSENQNCYLICNYTDYDIRTEPSFAPNEQRSPSESVESIHRKKQEYFLFKEERNLESLRICQDYLERINARSSLIKFRLNRSNTEDFTFSDGILILPIFADFKSGICRIIVDFENIQTKTQWDFAKKFLQINYWNGVIREKTALNPFTKTAEPMGKYRNRMEMCIFFSILSDYYKVIGYEFPSFEDVDGLFKNFITKN